MDFFPDIWLADKITANLTNEEAPQMLMHTLLHSTQWSALLSHKSSNNFYHLL